LFSSMNLVPVYGDPTRIDKLPPSILAAWAEESDGSLNFFVQADDVGDDGMWDTTGGVTQVYVTYMEAGQLITLELTFDDVTGFWTTTVQGLDISTEFLVQAVDVAGNTVADSNGGLLYSGGRTDLIVNTVNEPHRFVITVWADDGAGSSVVEGATPVVAVESPDGANPTYTTNCPSGTDEFGQCYVDVVSDQPGSVDVSATVQLEDFPNNLAVSASSAARKTFISSKVAPTQTTCEAFAAGTAESLDSVLFGAKNGLINNTAPGVFYYYTWVEAPPGGTFTVEIAQSSLPGYKLFEVQNTQQIRLFDENCAVLTPVSVLLGEQVALDIQPKGNSMFIVSIKYDTGSVVGEDAPLMPVKYTFVTVVNSEDVEFSAAEMSLLEK
jgi:hypothetical protein